MTENQVIPTDSFYSEKVKELVAIGAAIAANCEPCFKFHYNKANKIGISKEDMQKAVETGKMVKEASASNILELANKYLQNGAPQDQSHAHQITCCA